MGNYVFFALATLVLVVLNDFAAAKYVVPVDQLSVKQVNEQWPATIPTFVDVNSSAKSWLIHQNLWDILLPRLTQGQDGDESLLTPRQVVRKLTAILSLLNDCILTLINAGHRRHTLFFFAKDILGQVRWANLSFYLRDIQVAEGIIPKDLLTVGQTLRLLRPIRLFTIYAKDVLNGVPDDATEMILLLNIDLWSVVKDYLNPRTVEMNDLTPEQKRYFVKKLTRCSSTNNACVCD